jgi:uncharacterized protein (TIGR00251 family)
VSTSAELRVRVHPRAKREEVVAERDGVVVVRVTAPPVEGRANEALCKLIAKRARVGRKQVSIIRGAAAREKVVRVEGVTVAELRRALGLDAQRLPGRGN